MADIEAVSESAPIRIEITGGQGVPGADTWDELTGTVTAVPFNTAASAPATEGEVGWDSTEGTLAIALENGSVLQVGQEVLYHVENNTGSNIVDGTPVMYAGTVGNSGKLRVKPWDGSDILLFMGLATSDITDGDHGYVTHFGKVRGIQTNGANYSETWINGDTIYTDSTGTLTNVRPTTDGEAAKVGFIVSAHVSNGTIFLKQDRLYSKLNHTHTASQISDSTAAGRTLLTDADASAQRTSLGLGDSATKNVGTTTGTVAAGDDARLKYITGTAANGSTSGSIASNVDGSEEPARDTLGEGAVDLQSSRSAGTMVASGTYSFIAGGVDNTASGTASHSEGFGTTASGDYSHSEGFGTTASGDYSHAAGLTSTATADYARGVGRRANATHQGASVEADSQDADCESTATDQKTFRFQNGYRFLGGSADFITRPTFASSHLVDVAGTQTLTNKTLTSPTLTAPTISGAAVFTGTTRPTSAGTGTPSATSLITRDDGDTRYKYVVTDYLSSNGPAVNNSTTLVATGLDVSLATGTWLVEVDLHFSNTTTSAGGKVQLVTASGSTTSGRGTRSIANVNAALTSNGDFAAEISTATAIGGDGHYIAKGIITVNSAAVIEVHFAQGVATGTDSNALAGSWITATKIA